MTTTTTTREAEGQAIDLPALTMTDRFALAIGPRLILRAEQHRTDRAARAARTEHARIARADARAAHDADAAFAHRTHAGPTW